MTIDPNQAASLQQAAQEEFVWKGVTGIVTGLSVVVATLFGWLMRSKDNAITAANSKIQLLEQQQLSERKEAREREDLIRNEYEARLEEERRFRSREKRHYTRTIQMAQEAIALASEAPPRPAHCRSRYTEDDTELSTGVHDLIGQAKSEQVERELERLRQEKRQREASAGKLNRELDDELERFLHPSSSHPPPQQPRRKLPSRR